MQSPQSLPLSAVCWSLPISTSNTGISHIAIRILLPSRLIVGRSNLLPQQREISRITSPLESFSDLFESVSSTLILPPFDTRQMHSSTIAPRLVRALIIRCADSLSHRIVLRNSSAKSWRISPIPENCPATTLRTSVILCYASSAD